jgi:acetyl esterase/lipase
VCTLLAFQLPGTNNIEMYGAPPKDKRLSPLLNESHAGIAKKAFFAVCGWDPRRDEALLLEQLLKDVGIETKLEVYAGLPHGFWTTCPDLPVSKAFEQDLVNSIRWMLN